MSSTEDSLGDENSTTCGPTASTRIHITASVGLVMSTPCSACNPHSKSLHAAQMKLEIKDAVNNPSIAIVGVFTPFSRTSISQSNLGVSKFWAIYAPDSSVEPGTLRAPSSFSAPFSTHSERLSSPSFLQRISIDSVGN